MILDILVHEQTFQSVPHGEVEPQQPVTIREMHERRMKYVSLGETSNLRFRRAHVH